MKVNRGATRPGTFLCLVLALADMRILGHTRHMRTTHSRVRKPKVVTMIAVVGVIFGVLTGASGTDGAIALDASVAASSVSSDIPASTEMIAGDVVKAADLSKFDPSNIISDALFYDSGAMTAGEIQSFLDSKIGACQNGRCLNILNTSISSRDARSSSSTGNLICSALQGGTMRVSELIYRLQVSCGISAKVILVTLQKEQGLTTSRAPSDWNLSAAMGQACPDTAPCDPAYKGIGPQLVGGVTQLKTYRAAEFGKRPGVNYIQWSPTAGCGGTNINIQNWATASLYTYTPYQPNAAALRAGYGLGDGCSSYGNRNFYQYYVDWFGSTQVDVSAAPSQIADAYARLGGSNGVLGQAASAIICGLAAGGCFQNFQGGQIHWSRTTGAHPTTGAIRSAWVRANSENGDLGYPTSDEHCSGLPDNGCYQDFQSGKIYWTAVTDAHGVRANILSGWAARGYERGEIGYPVADEVCGLAGNGCSQQFQGSSIFWSPQSGAHPVRGSVAAAWSALGADASSLGYPVGAEGCGLPQNGCYQDFQRGKIYWSPSTGAYSVKGGILSRYAGSGYERGALGYPTSEETCGLAAGGCSQTYGNGAIYWSAPTDAQIIRGGMLSGYLALGGAASKLGYPLAGEGCGLPAGGCYQEFQGGMLHWSAATGAQPTWGAIATLWGQLSRERGVLGYPAGVESCDATGCEQTFQNGRVYWSAPTGAVSVRAALEAYLTRGARAGSLGYPVAEQTCAASSCTQRFQFGQLP